MKKNVDQISINVLILLLEKLLDLNINEKTFTWCKSYLDSRSFRVKVGDCLSESFAAPSGVPQGSCLSSLLYSIFVLDIGNYIPNDVSYLEYADDIKIYRTVENAEDHMRLQASIDGVHEWTVKNGMTLSVGKCVVLQYGNLDCCYYLEGNQLPIMDNTRDLGVIISPKLDFSSHIIETVKSANSIVNTIFRSFVVRKPEVYIQLYNSLVVSKFLYCAPVWFPATCKQRKMINDVQRRFLRRLHWRCGNLNASVLPDLTDKMEAMDLSTYRQLERAGTLSDLFNIQPNNLRSSVTVCPKERAKMSCVENMFAWRVAKKIHNSCT